MRVLVTWGSKRAGTAEIAAMVADGLRQEGVEVALLRPDEIRRLDGFDAVIVGGALYMNRWHRDARRFVKRNLAALRRVPVWFFSSGPLDDSADRQRLPPSNQVAVLMERVGAVGHETFGGRLEPDAQGFPASAMAKTQSGDWRNPARIRAWASEVARALPSARPGAAIDHPAGSLPRLLIHGLAGWALCAGVMGVLLRVAGAGLAVPLSAVVTVFVFAAIARLYFHARGARDPLPTALVFAGLTAVLDAIVFGGLAEASSASVLQSVTVAAARAVLVLVVTWGSGAVQTTTPWSGRSVGPSS